MKKHCSYIGRDCIATPGCAERECQAALAFPFGCGGEVASGGVTGHDDELIAAVRTLRGMGYIFEYGRWVGPLSAPQCLTTAPPESPAYVRQMNRVQPPSPIPFETEAAWLRHEHGPGPARCEHKRQNWTADMRRGSCADCGIGLAGEGVVVT